MRNITDECWALALRASCAVIAWKSCESLRRTSAASRATAAWALATSVGSMRGAAARRNATAAAATAGARPRRRGSGGDARGLVEAPPARELLAVVRLVEARDLDHVAGVRRVQELVVAEVHADVVDVARSLAKKTRSPGLRCVGRSISIAVGGLDLRRR